MFGEGLNQGNDALIEPIRRGANSSSRPLPGRRRSCFRRYTTAPTRPWSVHAESASACSRCNLSADGSSIGLRCRNRLTGSGRSRITTASLRFAASSERRRPSSSSRCRSGRRTVLADRRPGVSMPCRAWHRSAGGGAYERMNRQSGFLVARRCERSPDRAGRECRAPGRTARPASGLRAGEQVDRARAGPRTSGPVGDQADALPFRSRAKPSREQVHRMPVNVGGARVARSWCRRSSLRCRAVRRRKRTPVDLVVLSNAAAATVATRARSGVTSPLPSGCTRFDRNTDVDLRLRIDPQRRAGETGVAERSDRKQLAAIRTRSSKSISQPRPRIVTHRQPASTARSSARSWRARECARRPAFRRSSSIRQKRDKIRGGAEQAPHVPATPSIRRAGRIVDDAAGRNRRGRVCRTASRRAGPCRLATAFRSARCAERERFRREETSVSFIAERLENVRLAYRSRRSSADPARRCRRSRKIVDVAVDHALVRRRGRHSVDRPANRFVRAGELNVELEIGTQGRTCASSDAGW